MSKPIVRKVGQDLYFVEWGNVRFGGSAEQVMEFAYDLKAEMLKIIADGYAQANPERKADRP